MTKQLFLAIAMVMSFSFYSNAQTATTAQKPKDTIPREVRYSTYKQLYIKMRQSESQKIADSISQLFFYKITPDVDLIEISKENRDYMAWTRANLSKTEFKTLEEAEKLWNEYESAIKATTEENKDYYDYLREIRTFEGGAELQISFMKKVREEHPEKYKRIKLPKRPTKKELIPRVGPLKTN